MPFRPNPNDELTINGITYRIAEHPAAPGIPYGQEGRAGIVYQLLPSPTGRGAGGEGKLALKVFKPRFRTPALVALGARLNAYAQLPGLRVCERIVLTPDQHAKLLKEHPDLTYAVLMPWIEGLTWFDVLQEKRPLTPQQSLVIAASLCKILTTMEENGLAHCDLSAPNILLPVTANPAAESPLELVDVEQMYGLGLPRPEDISSGTAGYAPLRQNLELWSPQGDRFAGAILLAEMLGWCDESVRQAAWGESYFEPAEMQQESQRYHILLQALNRHWGKAVADLFERAWKSEVLADCPTFGEWKLALPESLPVADAFKASVVVEPTVPPAVVGGIEPPQVRPWAPVKSEGYEAAFRHAIEAYRRREWALARELLIPIVTESPNYNLEGYTARALLAEVERQARRRPVAGWVWGLIGGLAVLCLLGGGITALALGGAFFYTQSENSPIATIPTVMRQNNPTNATIPLNTLLPLPTYTPYPTYTLYVALTNTPEPLPTEFEISTNNPPSGKIVFTCQVSYNAKQNEICLINADGSGFRQLTNNGANNGYASFAPDGRSFVFSSTMDGGPYQLYEMDLQSSNLRQLTFGENDALGPDISPDGQKIVYKCSQPDGIDSICVMNRDGTEIRKIYGPGWDPVWSPDGSQILFMGGNLNNPTLYIIMENGSGLTALPPLPGMRGRSDWSVQGRIATYAGGSWERNIYILVDSEWQQLTNGGNSQAPSFSPDGNWIAFTAYFDHMNDPNGCEIYIMTIDGQNLTRLTDNSYCDWQPRWGS